MMMVYGCFQPLYVRNWPTFDQCLPNIEKYPQVLDITANMHLLMVHKMKLA